MNLEERIQTAVMEKLNDGTVDFQEGWVNGPYRYKKE